MAAMKRFDVVVIPGDGIGPELTEAALDVLRAIEKGAGCSLAFDHHLAGARLYRETGRAVSDETLARCKTASATLKGPVGEYSVRAPDGTEAGVPGGILRSGLDAFANVRPIRLYPGIRSALGAPARRAPSTTLWSARTRKAFTPRAGGASSRPTSCLTR